MMSEAKELVARNKAARALRQEKIGRILSFGKKQSSTKVVIHFIL